MTRTAQPAAKASEVESADTVRKVVAKVGEFPALLPVVQKALALVEQPAVTTLQLQRILSADPVMVSRVLRLANSAYFGVMAEVTTVSMAINIIGFHRLRSLLRHILVSGLLELLSHGRPAATVLRQLAIAASVASHEVAARDGEDDPEELLVAGLLVNVGSLALCWTFPKEYDSAWQQSAAAGREPPSIVLGVNPESMGRRVLEAWRFPIVFCEIVEKWPRPSGETTDAALRRKLAVVNSGVALARAHSKDAGPETLGILPEVYSELKLNETHTAEILKALPAKIEQIRAILEA